MLMINLTEEQEKAVVSFYLIPHSLTETMREFNFKSRVVVKRILTKHCIPQHSKQTRYQLRTETTKKSNLEKYGVDSTSKLDQTKAKRFATNILKYGSCSPASNKEVRQKIKNTCLKKYGVDNPRKAEVVKDKIKETTQQRYGTTSYMQSVQAKNESALRESKKRQTCLDRYGTEYYVQSADCHLTLDKRIQKANQTNLIRYGVKSALQNKSIMARKEATCLERYGVKNYTTTPEYKIKSKQTCLDKYGCEFSSQNVQVKLKGIETKRKHNTFNTSKFEQRFYKALLRFFDEVDVIYQYSDERYPFHCDFYIKSLDLFIELNLHWTHGNHPFDPMNKDDIEKLRDLKSKAQTKNSQFYDQAVYVWAELDPKKQQYAKNNNLNYRMFYTESEAISWLNSENESHE